MRQVFLTCNLHENLRLSANACVIVHGNQVAMPRLSANACVIVHGNQVAILRLNGNASASAASAILQVGAGGNVTTIVTTLGSP